MMFSPSLQSKHVILGQSIDLEIMPRPPSSEDQTGGVVWPVNYIMAKFMEASQISFCGRKVIELGAGTGILSISAAACGAHVTATDLPDFISMLHTNVARNTSMIAAAAATSGGGGTVRVMGHRWGEGAAELGGPFDVVLCCELLYWGGWSLLAEDTRAPLLRSLKDLTAPSREAELAMDWAGKAATAASGGRPRAVKDGGPVLMGFAVRNAAREREFFAAATVAFSIQYCHVPFGGNESGDRGATAAWLTGSAAPPLYDELPDEMEDGDVIFGVMRRKECSMDGS